MFLLLLILLVLFTPINVVVNYSDGLNVHIIIFGLKIKIPTRVKKKTRKNHDKNYKQENNTKKKKNSNIISFGLGIIKIGVKTFIEILKGIKIKEIVLKVKVSGSDAAKTALLYAKFSSVIYPFFGGVISNAELESYDINVSPDFLGDKTTFFLNFHFYGTVFQILKSFLYFIKEYNKIIDK